MRYLVAVLILSGSVPERVYIEKGKVISNSPNLKIETVDNTIIVRAL